MTALEYDRDPASIYARSFATIEAEADLGAFSPEERPVAIRMIHASGMVDIVEDLRISGTAVQSAARALSDGAPILCDAEMVRHGIIGARLARQNEVRCHLNEPEVKAIAEQAKTTRSAAQIELWRGNIQGSIVVIGNAPTALFRLIELIESTGEMPAIVVGTPVGFIGASESKELLAASSIPHITILGRRGGSALAASAINALAGLPSSGSA